LDKLARKATPASVGLWAQPASKESADRLDRRESKVSVDWPDQRAILALHATFRVSSDKPDLKAIRESEGRLE